MKKLLGKPVSSLFEFLLISFFPIALRKFHLITVKFVSNVIAFGAGELIGSTRADGSNDTPHPLLDLIAGFAFTIQP
jgi:hypothetical protein